MFTIETLIASELILKKILMLILVSIIYLVRIDIADGIYRYFLVTVSSPLSGPVAISEPLPVTLFVPLLIPVTIPIAKPIHTCNCTNISTNTSINNNTKQNKSVEIQIVKNFSTNGLKTNKMFKKNICY